MATTTAAAGRACWVCFLTSNFFSTSPSLCLLLVLAAGHDVDAMQAVQPSTRRQHRFGSGIVCRTTRSLVCFSPTANQSSPRFSLAIRSLCGRVGAEVPASNVCACACAEPLSRQTKNSLTAMERNWRPLSFFSHVNLPFQCCSHFSMPILDCGNATQIFPGVATIHRLRCAVVAQLRIIPA
ncbi:hypothetical protein IWZ01DRAFT_27635 [Phyllosticta capitalensis]